MSVKKYNVEVQKTYYERTAPEITNTIHGTITIEAATPGAAIVEVNRLLETGLKTDDKRIIWENLTRLGNWEYQDWTFQTTGRTV